MANPNSGHEASHIDFGGGNAMWVLYCEHNRCGAYAFIGSAQIQWALHSPIQLVEFLTLVRRTADIYLEVGASTTQEPPGESRKAA